MRRILNLVLVGVLGALALSACSTNGSNSSGAEPATSSTTVASTTSTSTPRSEGPSRAAYSVAFSDAFEAIDGDRCLSGRMVDLIGLERLHAADVSADDFVGGDLLRSLGIQAAERADLKTRVAAEMEACGTADNLATYYLDDDDPKWEMTSFAPCVAKPLQPLVAAAIVDRWAGERSGSVVDDLNDALDVADAGCPELEVETAGRAASEAGRDLTSSERSCALRRYQQLAGEHRALVDDDHAAVAAACFEH